MVQILRYCAIIVAVAALAGCVHMRRPETSVVPAKGAPNAKAIVADLAANDARIDSFREKQALLSIKSPKLRATQVVSADVGFRRSGDLFIVARQRMHLGGIAFRLVSVGDVYAVRIPSEHRTVRGTAGEPVEDVPFAVSPSDIARALFLPEDWATLDPTEVRVSAFDPATSTATLLIGPKEAPRHRLTVSGPPWRVITSERIDERGQVYAKSTRSDYRDWNAISFPTTIEAVFPEYETEVKLYKIDDPQFNTPLEESLFVIDER